VQHKKSRSLSGENQEVRANAALQFKDRRANNTAGIGQAQTLVWVAESLAAGAIVSKVARRHGLAQH
jgi:hypothetical protein